MLLRQDGTVTTLIEMTRNTLLWISSRQVLTLSWEEEVNISVLKGERMAETFIPSLKKKATKL